MKKAISMVLAALMLLALPITSFGATDLSRPEVTIAVNNIKDETMEVALKVGTGNFKSVGAVLEYDATKLQPIRWSTTAAIDVPKDPDNAADGWAHAAVIESICPDNLSGKPALAYQSGGTGYLYLGAEAAAALNFTEATQVVTVRFAYLAAAGDDRFANAAATVKFAQDNNVAFASPVKGSMIYQTEDRTTGEYKFYYFNPLTDLGSGVVTDPSVPGDVVTGEPTVDPVPDGDTANKGEANTDDFVSVTFYDWDGTLLGTRIIAKGTGSLIDPNTAENKDKYSGITDDAELAALGVAPKAPEGGTLTNGADISAVNKAGYTYAGWVDYSGTSTPEVAGSAAAGQSITANGQTLVALSGLTQNAVLRAAYDEKTTAEGGIGSTARNRRYKVSHSAFVESEDGSSVITTITVKRDSASRRSTSGTMLAVTLRPYGLGETQLLVPLGDADLETYQLIMPLAAYRNYSVDNGVSYELRAGNGSTLSDSNDITAAEMQVK